MDLTQPSTLLMQNQSTHFGTTSIWYIKTFFMPTALVITNQTPLSEIVNYI